MEQEKIHGSSEVYLNFGSVSFEINVACKCDCRRGIKFIYIKLVK